MFEDYRLDENFRVESSEDFLNDLSYDERNFALKTMIPCNNCGEFRPKSDKYIQLNGTCYLCYKSEDHKAIRGKSYQSFENYHSIKALIQEYKKMFGEL